MSSCIDVSIIIPVYKVEEYIESCLQSVVEQTAGCRMECIIVDDRGNDKSIEIAQNFVDKYSGSIEFKILKREKNGGPSATRNTGLREAKGRYIFFLDSDDILTSDCIKKLYVLTEKYPGVEMVTGDFQTFPEKGGFREISLEGKEFPEYSEDLKWIRVIFLENFPVVVWNKLILRDFIENNELYFMEGIIHEDNHWMVRAYHAIRTIAFTRDITYLYRMHAGSIMHQPNYFDRKVDNIYKLCCDIFEREYHWDAPWAKWVFEMMLEIRRHRYWLTDKKKIRRYYKVLFKKLKDNPLTPISAWKVLNYYKTPRLFYSKRKQARLIEKYLKVLRIKN